ncbi:MAG: carboxypeptidase-like regulatory domain-containing protein [Candidatus Firestonebacteria bacterium]
MHTTKTVLTYISLAIFISLISSCAKKNLDRTNPLDPQNPKKANVSGRTYAAATQTIQLSSTANYSTAIASVSVSITSSDNKSLTTTSSSTGAYSFTDITPGIYKFLATKTGYTDKEQTNVQVKAEADNVVDLTLDAVVPTTTTTTTTTATNGKISGKVVDNYGSPLINATVSITPASGSSPSATTDALGAFTINDVPAGTYSATTARRFFQSYSTTGITVTSGQTTTLSSDIALSVGNGSGSFSENFASALSANWQKDTTEEPDISIYDAIANGYIGQMETFMAWAISLLNTHGYLRRSITPTLTKARIEAFISKGYSDNGEILVSFTDYYNTNIIGVGIYGTGSGGNSKLQYKNGSTYTDISTGAIAQPNTWYRVIIEMDASTKKANIYVNEIPTFATYKYSATDIAVSSSSPYIEKIQISAGPTVNVNSGSVTWYLDELVLSPE